MLAGMCTPPPVRVPMASFFTPMMAVYPALPLTTFLVTLRPLSPVSLASVCQMRRTPFTTTCAEELVARRSTLRSLRGSPSRCSLRTRALSPCSTSVGLRANGGLLLVAEQLELHMPAVHIGDA